MAEVRRDRWGRYLIVPPNGGKPQGYTRATTVAKSLDDGGGLIPWKATLAMTGLMRRPGLRGRFEALYSQHPDAGPWYGSAESKAESKKLVEECATAGGSTDRADVGTALHAIVEQINLGQSPIISQDSTKADLAAYRQSLDANGITFDTSLIECVLALDAYQVAGTTDMGRATVPGMGDLVADLKTGADLKYSWQAIAIQLAIYANADSVYVQGDAADGTQDQRLAMPAISKEWGLVIHLPAGEARCELYLVDLVAGWEAFQHSMFARAWRSRKDVAKPFGIPIAGAASPAAAPVATGAAAPASVPPPDFDAPASTSSAVSPPAPAEPAAAGAAEKPAPAAPPDFDAPSAIDAAAHVDWRTLLPGVGQNPQTQPDEGEPLTMGEAEALQARFAALPKPRRSWISERLMEAQNGGVSVHISQAQTVRRLELVRGLLTLSEHWPADGDVEGDPDAEVGEITRVFIAAALDDEIALQPIVTIGHALGACDHVQAAAFARSVDAFVAGGAFRALATASPGF